MKEVKKRLLPVLAVGFVLSTGVGLLSMNTRSSNAEEQGYVRLTETYNSQKNYAGGSIYANKVGIGVRTVGDISKVSGAYFLGTTFTVDEAKTVTANKQAVVFDVSVIGFDGTYVFRLGTDKGMSSGGIAYLYKGETFVKTVTAASYGLLTLPSDGTYDKVVIPVTSMGITAGTEYTVEKISVLERQGYQTANTAKYVMHGAYLLDDYTANGAITLTEENKIYTPSKTNFSLYGQNTTNYTPSDYIDARYMEQGDLLFDDAINCGSSNTPALEKLYFRIDESETVNLLQEYDGFYYTLTNTDTETDYNFLWGLTANSTSYWSNVQTGAKCYYQGGTEASVTPRYMHKGVENAIYYVPFTAFGNLADVDENTAFKNYLLLQVYASNASNNANPKLNENGGVMMNIGSVTFVKDGTLRKVGTSEGVSVNRVNGFDGTEIIYTAKTEVKNAVWNGNLLSAEEISRLNGDGYKVTLNGADSYLSAGDYVVSVNTPEHGTVEISETLCNEDTGTVLSVKPEYGYTVDKILVNDVDKTQELGTYFNNKLYLFPTENLNVEVSFKKATEYSYENGTVSSLWGCPDATVFAEFDSVSVQTTKAYADTDTTVDYIGLTIPVDSQKVGKYIAVQVQSIVNNYRYFYMELVGDETYRRTSGKSYYYALVDGTTGQIKSVEKTYGETEEPEDIKGTCMELRARKSKYTNATLDTETNLKANTQGFNGYVIVNLDDFGDVEYDKINLYCANFNKSYSRFNIGNVYSCTLNANGLPVFGNVLWTPDEEYSLYGETSVVANVQRLEKGEMIMQNRGNRGDVPYAYDEAFFTFPENAIGPDGYVDLQETGIKGVAITVETERTTRLILRVSGAENDGTYVVDGETRTVQNLLKNDHAGVDIWQTSGSSHPSLVKLDTGLVKTSSSYYLPYYENYDGTYTLYIEFSDTMFSNWNGRLNFPTKLQPVMLLLGEDSLDDGETAKVTFKSIRFLTDDSEFQTKTISLTPLNGVINGKIGTESVMASSNNHVIPGTKVQFSVTPNKGYKLTEIWYVCKEDEIDIDLADLDENGVFEIVVNEDINVYAECKKIYYTIEYNLDGGTNSEKNPTTYSVTDRVEFTAPTKKGYKFIGWFDENGEEIKELKNSAKDVVLTARYEKAKGCSSALDYSVLAVVGLLAVCVLTLQRKTKEREE